MIESRRSFGLGLALLGALLGCAGDDQRPGTSEGGIGAAGAGAFAPVPCESDIPEFAYGPAGIGLEAMGVKQIAKARVIDAKPASPERFENVWKVAFMDAQGAPLTDVQVASACAFMPKHGHSARARAITPLMDPGTFELDTIDLSMAGPWEVQLAINAPSLGAVAGEQTSCDRSGRSLGAEKIVFRICAKD